MTQTVINNVLAVDTATRSLNLALRFGGDRLVASSEEVSRTHGQIIIKKIDELFQSAGLNVSDLQALVISLGPGSFTGLRIGLAVVKGVAVAQDLPVAGVTLFEIAAHRLAKEPNPIQLLIPSRRDEFYTATIQRGEIDPGSIQIVGTGQLVDVVAGREVYAIGFDPAAELGDMPDGWSAQELTYKASDLMQVGLEKLSRGALTEMAELEPAYLQKAIAEVRFDQKHGHD